MKRRYINLGAALEITGQPTTQALAKWIERWNLRNPNSIVLRPRGKVDANALEEAWEENAISQTPGARRIQAVNNFLGAKAGHARQG